LAAGIIHEHTRFPAATFYVTVASPVVCDLGKVDGSVVIRITEVEFNLMRRQGFWSWFDLVFAIFFSVVIAVAVVIVGVAIAATTAGAADFLGSEIFVVIVTTVTWTGGVGGAVVWGTISIVDGAIFIVIVANWFGIWVDIFVLILIAILIWVDLVFFVILIWGWWSDFVVVQWVVANAVVCVIWVAVATTTADAAHELRVECIGIVLSSTVLSAPVSFVSSTAIAIGVASSEVGIPAGLRGRGWEFDWYWHRSLSIIVGWTVGTFESIDVLNGEVFVVDTPGSDGPISLSAVHVGIPVPDSVVDSGFTGWDDFTLKPGGSSTRVEPLATSVAGTFLVDTVIRVVVHLWASRSQRCSIAPGVGAVLPDVSTNVESLIGTVVGDSDLMLGAGAAPTLGGSSRSVRGVVLHQEPLQVPVRSVLVDLGSGEVDHVRVQVDVENTIVGKLMDFGKLSLELGSPA
jgi:hypothetical protein